VSVALDPTLLLFALTAALVGGMTSFPLTMVGGVLSACSSASCSANSSQEPGTNYLVMFIVLVVLVLLRARSQSDESAWTLTPRARSGQAELLKHPLARFVRYGGIALLIAIGLLLPSFETLPSRLIDYATSWCS